MQRAFGRQAGLLRIGLDEFGDPVDESVGDALADVALAPGQVRALGLGLAALVLGCQLHQPLGVGELGVTLRAVEDHVLDGDLQLFGDVVIDR